MTIITENVDNDCKYSFYNIIHITLINEKLQFICEVHATPVYDNHLDAYIFSTPFRFTDFSIIHAEQILIPPKKIHHLKDGRRALRIPA